MLRERERAVTTELSSAPAAQSSVTHSFSLRSDIITSKKLSVLSLCRHSSQELYKDKELILKVVFTWAFGKLPYGGQTERESN